MYDVIVIGGGPAGVTAALRARELGAAVALVERGRMGGTCTNDGCVPTRVLAKAARLVRDARHFSDYGLVGSAPEVDLPELLARTQHLVYRIHEKKQLIGHLERAGVAVHSDAGAARFVDPQSVALGNGTRLQAHRFVLCAGGHARRISLPGSEHVLTHSDVWGMKSLPRRLAVVGGAATGCQLASIFAAFGSEVTVLDTRPRLLSAEDETVSDHILEAFRARGIQARTGIGGVERIERANGALRLHYSVSGTSQWLEAESVIMAVGWQGNVDDLGLADAGVNVERGYVVVDDRLRTSAEHIFAAGDITGRMMLVQSAAYEARIAAENATLGGHRAYVHHIVPHGGFTDPEYGSVGLTEARAREQEDCAVAVVPYAELDRAVVDGHTEGFCKLVVSRDTRRVLGAHVVGEQAVEIVQMMAAGMAMGMRVEQLAELELAYPTYAGILGIAARQITRGLGIVLLAREWGTLPGQVAAEWEQKDG